MSFRSGLYAAFAAVLLLCGCAQYERAQTAGYAKTMMVGMPKEEVLACMGVPSRKAQEGDTEVWFYRSTNGLGTSGSYKYSSKGSSFNSGSHSKYFCDINIVMRNDRVDRVHYNGPTGDWMFAKDDQCGYAVQHCVDND